MKTGSNQFAWLPVLMVAGFYGYIISDIVFGNGSELVIAYMLSAVVAVGVIGALIVRLQPKGMFYVLMVMAIIQGVEAVVMLFMPPSSLGPTLTLNGFLIAGCVVAGVIFKKSAQVKPEHR